MIRIPTLRYRCPLSEGSPAIGTILMGEGPRVRRAYRVLSATRSKSCLVGLGVVTWRIKVEPMSADAGRKEIEDGTPYWSIKWDSRAPRHRS